MPPGAGKFDVVYAWPLMLTCVFSIQNSPTVYGATSPRNVIEVKEVQEKNAKFPMPVTLLPMVTAVKGQ